MDPNANTIKIGMISLGCPKNQVDAELMLGTLSAHDFVITNDTDDMDIVIINTCGFIEDAKRESIENIFEMVNLKNEGKLKKIIVTGCMAERYREELAAEIPEADAVVGIGANGNIAEICLDAACDIKTASFPPKSEMPLCGTRLLTTPKHWAYLKIADGCSNCCTYCAIPLIRGAFRSRGQEEIVEEARQLAKDGVRELILIAQDSTRYGEDLYDHSELPRLLNSLCEIEDIKWIRILYFYPDRITDELLDTMAAQPKILKYMDLPLQHADGNVLRSMNRSGSYDELKALIEKIRRKMPEIVIRTTFITGFPGESEEQFEALHNFIKEIEFDRLGCFAYSPEEGTPAADMRNQIPDEVKKRRGELIMESQYRIAEKKNRQKIGMELEVVTEGADEESGMYVGRSYMDAPEIDGSIYFESEKELKNGDFVSIKITDAEDYDLFGKVKIGG